MSNKIKNREIMAARKFIKPMTALLVVVAVLISVTACSDTQNLKGDSSSGEKNDFLKYDDIYYSNIENYERYEKYSTLHPEFTEEEVVWRVEASADLKPYEQSEYITEAEENSITCLVNKHRIFREDYVPENLVTLKGNYKVTAETAEAFRRMESDAEKEGINLEICSAYRSMETQQNLYSRYYETDRENADRYSARPGSSEHHTGRAIDMVAPDGTLENFKYTQAYSFIKENGYKYGFIMRYQEGMEDITGYMTEQWHITYVGENASTVMHDKEIYTFEEYWVKYVKYKPVD